MQKKIIALAIAGLSTAAFAQSNVQISGQMKLHFEGVQASGAAAGSASDALSRNRVTQNTSNIIFKGEENLGGGMTAFFNIDSEVNADAPGIQAGSSGGYAYPSPGNGSGLLGSRQAWVGLGSTQYGSIAMGRFDFHYTEHAAVDAAGFDALSLSANSLNLFGQLGQTSVAAGSAAGTRYTMGGRWDNAVRLMSPNWNGLSAKFQYSVGTEVTAAQPANSAYGKDSTWNFVLRYDNGPIAAGWSRLQLTNYANSTALNGTGVTVMCLNPTTGAVSASTTGACTAPLQAASGATGAAIAYAGQEGIDASSDKFWLGYTFPMGLKVGVIADRSRRTNVNGATAGVDLQRAAWTIPVSYKTGNHTFYFTVGEAGSLTGGAANAAGVNTNSGAKQHMLAYNYDLSKRTAVNVSWTRLTNDNNAGFDYWTRNVQQTSVVGADPSSLAVGMRHSF